MVEHYSDFDSSGLVGEGIGEAHCLMYGLIRYLPQKVLKSVCLPDSGAFLATKSAFFKE